MGSACCRTRSSEGCLTTSVSNVERKISGLERERANRMKSSSTLEDMLLVVDVIEGRVTAMTGLSGLFGVSVSS